MADFSLSLNEDQLQLKEWVHGFAKDVMRPAAEEWEGRNVREVRPVVFTVLP